MPEIFDRPTQVHINNQAQIIKNWACQRNPRLDDPLSEKSIAQRAWLRWMMQPKPAQEGRPQIPLADSAKLHDILNGATTVIFMNSPRGLLSNPGFVKALSNSSEWYYYHQKIGRSVAQGAKRRWTDLFPPTEDDITFKEAAERAREAYHSQHHRTHKHTKGGASHTKGKRAGRAKRENRRVTKGAMLADPTGDALAGATDLTGAAGSLAETASLETALADAAPALAEAPSLVQKPTARARRKRLLKVTHEV